MSSFVVNLHFSVSDLSRRALARPTPLSSMICWPPHSEVLDRNSFPLLSPETYFTNIASGSTSAFRCSRFSALICVAQMQHIFRCGSLNFLSSSMSRTMAHSATESHKPTCACVDLEVLVDCIGFLSLGAKNAVADLLEFCFRFHDVLPRVRGTMLHALHILLSFHADDEASSRARLRYSSTVDVTIFHARHDGRLSTAFRHHIMTTPTDFSSNLLLSAPSHSAMRTTMELTILGQKAISAVIVCASRLTFSVSSHFGFFVGAPSLELQKALVRTLLLGGARSPESSLLRDVCCLKPSPAHLPAGAGPATALLDVSCTSREGQD